MKYHFGLYEMYWGLLNPLQSLKNCRIIWHCNGGFVKWFQNRPCFKKTLTDHSRFLKPTFFDNLSLSALPICRYCQFETTISFCNWHSIEVVTWAAIYDKNLLFHCSVTTQTHLHVVVISPTTTTSVGSNLIEISPSEKTGMTFCHFCLWKWKWRYFGKFRNTIVMVTNFHLFSEVIRNCDLFNNCAVFVYS